MVNKDRLNEAERNNMPWVISTYFVQGLPFTIVRILSTVFFTDAGVKESLLGYLNLLNAPWNFKFLWAPFLDGWGTKRLWMIALQAILAALCLILTGVSIILDLYAGANWSLQLCGAVFVVMAVVAATSDVAIDGYYLEGLTSRELQTKYSGYRVLAYRLAMVVGRFGLVLLVGNLMLHGLSVYLAWSVAFATAAALLAGLAVWHVFNLPRFEDYLDRPGRKNAFDSYRQAFKSYLARPKILQVLLFILFYKIGDEVMFSMVTPFLKRELGVSNSQYAWISGGVGAFGAVAGTMLGAAWIKRVGLERAIWPITIIMNGAIVVYLWLALEKPSATEFNGLMLINLAHLVEQVAAGLGAAVLLVYLLSTCDKAFKAAHYAIGSAIMSVPGTLVGLFSGTFVENHGYSGLFVLSLILTLPAFAVLYWSFPPKLLHSKSIS